MNFKDKVAISTGAASGMGLLFAESIAIGGMLSQLTELEAPPIEFDEKLWHAVVERLTVYNDDRLVYSLRDGTEITVSL